MSTPPFGSKRCDACKGTGLNKHTADGDCWKCLGQGWLTPDRQKELAARQDQRKDS